MLNPMVTAQLETLEKHLRSGFFTPGHCVDPDSVVCLVHMEGTVPVQYTQTHLPTLHESIQKALMGKKKGDAIDGVIKLKIVGVFDMWPT